MSPATLLQRTMERLAGTDMRAAITYEQSVRDFHANLRAWYYPKMFKSDDFNPDWAIGGVPTFDPSIETGAESDLSN